MHIAVIPGVLAGYLSESTREVPIVPRPEAASRAELLSALDRSVAAARTKLSTWNEVDLRAEWKLTRGPDTVLALRRIDMVRAIMLNHWYHHRGQLTVYLRLLDGPVPSVYGASADEDRFG